MWNFDEGHGMSWTFAKMIWVIRFNYASFLFRVQDEPNLHWLVLILNQLSWNGISQRFGNIFTSQKLWAFPRVWRYKSVATRPRIPCNGETWSRHDNFIYIYIYMDSMILIWLCGMTAMAKAFFLVFQWCFLTFQSVSSWDLRDMFTSPVW